MSLPILPARTPGNRVAQQLDHYDGLTSLAFVALLVGLASLAVGFAAACDRLLGPDEPVLAETGPPRTELESA